MGVGNKRGKSALALLFYTFFSLILAAFFVIAVLSKVRAATSDSLYYKKFYSRDLALLVDSLHAANGDMVVDYGAYTSEQVLLDVSLEKDRVILTDSSDRPLESRPKTAFLFGYNDYVEIKPATLTIYPFELDVAYSNESITFAYKQVLNAQPEGQG